MKPIIGIVSKYRKNCNTRQEALIRDELKNSVIDCGGVPIGILTTETELNFTPQYGEDFWEETLTDQQKEDLIQQINLCDGIILQGGVNSLKYESWIAKYTFDNDIPTLGICAGQNAMVRAVGGTTRLIDNPDQHNKLWEDEVHNIYIDENSKFYEIVKTKKMVVNSRHKKVIANHTEFYKPSAVCDDGYYDVLEAPNKKFNFALRFHPESLYKKYSTHKAIIEAFINSCKIKTL